MSLIKDREQFNKFLDILPELKNDEVYFISLSARNKYLSKDEREFYSLGQTEMFGREVAQSKEKLKDYTMRKLEANLYSKRTRNGKVIPDKSLVCYMNVNPSSMVKAYFTFQNEMNRQISEITGALLSDKQPNYSFVNIQTRELMNCIQKSKGTKHYIDIDCDTKEEEIYNYILSTLLQMKIKVYAIETKGGYHFLLDRKTIPEKYNLNDVIRNAQDKLLYIYEDKYLEQDEDGDYNYDEIRLMVPEIMINSNAMIPVPGTMQSDHLVKFKYIG